MKKFRGIFMASLFIVGVMGAVSILFSQVDASAYSWPRVAPCGSYGDVVHDGIVDGFDVRAIGQHVYRAYNNGESELSPLQRVRADVDGDGEITHEDMERVGEYIFFMRDTFSVCYPPLLQCDPFVKVADICWI